MSSSKSIRNDDYTSLDFIQQLISSTTKIQSENSVRKIPSIGEISNGHSIKQNNNSNHNYDVVNPVPFRLARTHSLLQTEPRQLRNFKQFYSALIGGIYDQQQAQHVWKQFQNCVDHTIQLDKFIQEFNKNKAKMIQKNKKQHQSSNKIKQIHQEIQVNRKENNFVFTHPKRSKTQNKSEKIKNKNRSLRKTPKNNANLINTKKLMKQQINYIEKVIQHGKKFIHS